MNNEDQSAEEIEKHKIIDFLISLNEILKQHGLPHEARQLNRHVTIKKHLLEGEGFAGKLSIIVDALNYYPTEIDKLASKNKTWDQKVDNGYLEYETQPGTKKQVPLRRILTENNESLLNEISAEVIANAPTFADSGTSRAKTTSKSF